jgi:hypothetical protein
MSSSTSPLAEAPARTRGRPGLPRLLAGVATHGSVGLDAHLQIHGELPHERRRRRREPQLIELIERSGLRGRGGAAFPTAMKLSAFARARRRPIIVINAAEGEPASLKDRTLCELTPHLTLDGGRSRNAAGRPAPPTSCV